MRIQQPHSYSFFSLTVIFGVIVFVGSYAFTQAQNFASPQFAAPKNDDLNQVDNLTSYVRTTDPQSQSTDGSFFVGSSQTTTAHISSSTYAIGIVGVSGDDYPPSPSSLGITNAGVYGYATGDSSSAGIFGSAIGQSGAGVLGRVLQSTGTAGAFQGLVRIIAGDLFVEDSAEVRAVTAQTSSQTDDAVFSSTGIDVSGAIDTAVVADSDYWYGLYGQSTNDIGISISTDFTDGSYGGERVSAITGSSMDGTGAAGVYGLSASGNGVEAIVGAASSLPAAYGESVASTGYGVYGEGGTFAGYFEGDVVISSGNSLILDSVEISESTLQDLITWCNSDGKIYCPDPSS